MNPFTKVWFWLMIISIIGIIVSAILFEQYSQITLSQTYVPAWLWVILGISLVLFIISFILYCVEVAAYYKRLAAAEECGTIVCQQTNVPSNVSSPHCPSSPKKTLKCKKKLVTECVKPTNCTNIEPQSQVLIPGTISSPCNNSGKMVNVKNTTKNNQRPVSVVSNELPNNTKPLVNITPTGINIPDSINAVQNNSIQPSNISPNITSNISPTISQSTISTGKIVLPQSLATVPTSAAI